VLPLLAKLATDPATPDSERLRYFRALDFQDAAGRQSTLMAILASPAGSSAALTPIVLSQLDARSAKDVPEVKAALARSLASVRGTPKFVELVERYDVRDQLDELVRLAIEKPNETAGTEAARVAIAWGGAPRLGAVATGADGDGDAARRAITVLSRNFSARVDSIVVGAVLDTSRGLELRRWAVQSLGNSYNGTQRLLALVQAGRIGAELKPAAGSVLFSAGSEVREAAAKFLTPPPSTTLDGKTLAPLLTLAARTGDATTGRAVFQRSCTSCHVAAGVGTDFGPALTEIGDKLPKSGLYLAILDPSAGISFGYEGWTVRTRDGQTLVGMLSSETDDELTMKLIGGIQRKVPKSTIAERKRMDASLMPHGLERTMSEADLVNLVEYLSTLKKGR
jgi:putative heme-binding domain-containing protein